MQHLCGNLRREGRLRSDQGRASDPARFRARPELGLRKVERECLQTEWAKQVVREVVEVLPRDEFEEDHLPGAIHIPLSAIETEARRLLDPGRPVVVYCWDTA